MKKLFLFSTLLLSCFSASATMYTLSASLDGVQENPDVATAATGTLTGTYDDVTNSLSYTITYMNLSSALQAAHFHGPAPVGVNTGVKIGLTPGASPMTGTVTVVQSDEADLLGGLWYVNLHTVNFGGGEIRGQMSAVALPVELVRFDATAKNSMVYLDWKTATELNNDYFQVAYSQDGRHFVEVGTVKGQGTSQAAKNYAFTHQRPVKGTNYYRLQQVDFDGQYQYSAVVSVEVEMNEIYLFPNPTTGVMQLNGPSMEGTVRVTDSMGKLVQVQDLSKRQGLDISQQPKGIYLVEIRAGNQTTVKRIVKE